jgi:hypothetical protein
MEIILFSYRPAGYTSDNYDDDDEDFEMYSINGDIIGFSADTSVAIGM